MVFFYAKINSDNDNLHKKILIFDIVNKTIKSKYNQMRKSGFFSDNELTKEIIADNDGLCVEYNFEVSDTMMKLEIGYIPPTVEKVERYRPYDKRTYDKISENAKKPKNYGFIFGIDNDTLSEEESEIMGYVTDVIDKHSDFEILGNSNQFF